jgi:hypothetical protein
MLSAPLFGSFVPLLMAEAAVLIPNILSCRALIAPVSYLTARIALAPWPHCKTLPMGKIAGVPY